MNLNDLFEGEEAKRLAEYRAELAAENAAFDALPQEEKDRIIAAENAAFDAAFDEAFEAETLEAFEEEDDDDD